jgi:hypothetical protein
VPNGKTRPNDREKHDRQSRGNNENDPFRRCWSRPDRQPELLDDPSDEAKDP